VGGPKNGNVNAIAHLSCNIWIPDPPQTPEFGAEYRILLEFCQNMCQPEHQNVLFVAGTGIGISNVPITITL